MASPSTLSGLQVWIDPNSVTSYTLSSGSNLTSITDTVGSYSFSGTSFILSNAFGSRSALGFYTNELLSNSSYTFPNSEYSIFLVAKLFSTSTTPRVALSASPTSTLSFSASNTNILLQNGNGSSWNMLSNTPSRSAQDAWRILSMIYDGSSTITYINSLQQQYTSGSTGSLTRLDIGSSWNGAIGDILIYNRSLTSQERESVVSFLNSAWNFVPPSPPQITIRPHAMPNELRFYWNPPSNVGSGITSYSLDCVDPFVSTLYVNSNSRFYFASNLSNGVNHQFSLTATNESGDSSSQLFRFVQPGYKPSSLTSVSYSLIPPNAVLVKWNEPVYDPSIIRDVVAFYPIDSNEVIQPQLSTIISYGTTYKSTFQRLVYLSNVNCNYKFIARQVNDPGWSPNDLYRYIRVSYNTFSPSSISQSYLWLETQTATSYSTNTSNQVVNLVDLSPTQVLLNSNGVGLPNYPLLSNSVNGINTVSFATSLDGLSQSTVLSSITDLFWVGKQGSYTTRNSLLGSPTNRYWDGASNHYILHGVSPAGLTDAPATLYLSREIPYQKAFSSIVISPSDRTFLLHVKDITGPSDFNGICFSSNTTNGTAGWRGDFCEALAFTSSLNTNEISTVTSYLTSKWGIYQTPSFSPIQAPGLFLWLDASSPSYYDLSGGTDVIRLRDRSYNSNDMYQPHLMDSNGTPTFFWPTLGTPINGISTISFQSEYTALKQPRELNGVKHFFWVGRQNSSNDHPTLLGHPTETDWHSFGNFYISDSEAAVGIRTAPGTRYTADGEYFYRSTCSYIPIPTSNDVFLLSINNITGNTRFTGMCFDVHDDHGWQGDFAECLCFNQTLSSEMQQQVETYLRLKWNIYS